MNLYYNKFSLYFFFIHNSLQLPTEKKQEVLQHPQHPLFPRPWESKGVSPEVHDHLHSFERVQLQVVKTASDSQLLNLLSVSRLGLQEVLMVVWTGVQSGVFCFFICNITYSDCLPVVDYPQCWGMVKSSHLYLYSAFKNTNIYGCCRCGLWIAHWV